MHQPDLKILLITESASAGVGRHVVDLAEGLLEHSCRVDIVYSGLRMDTTFAGRLSANRRLRHHQIDMRRVPHLGDLGVIRRVRHYIKTHGPFDVVHAHSSKGGIIARSVRRRDNQAILYTPHCIYTLNPVAGRVAYGITRSVERRLAHRTDAIIAVSPEERQHIVELGVDAGKVHYIANGVHTSELADAGAHAERRRLGLPSTGAVVGYLGRLSVQKDPLLLVEAFGKVAQEFPDATLAIAGDGPLERQTRRRVDQLGLARRVRWLGYRPAKEVLPVCDVFAVPSRYEGMPYVLLEAISAGLPIVATAVGGVSQTVRHGQNGLITPDRSAEAFAAALHTLLADPELRRRYGRCSRELATRFTAEGMVRQTYWLYSELLGRPRTVLSPIASQPVAV